jgi:hypothetical protein
VAAAAAALCASSASAQEAPLVRRHVLQRELPAPHRDVETSAALVSSAGEWLDAAAGVPAGSSVSLVCGLANKGDRRLNVTLVVGMLSDRYNNERLVKDLGRDYIERGAVVDPAAPDGDVGPAEVSFAFSFRLPDEAALRANKASGFTGFPYKVRLSAAVFYDEHVSSTFASAFFNETITIVAPGGALVDVHSLVPGAVGSLVTACVLFMFLDSVPAFAEGHSHSLASYILAAGAALVALVTGAKAAAPSAADGGKKAAAGSEKDDDDDESKASGVVRSKAAVAASPSPRRGANS